MTLCTAVALSTAAVDALLGERAIVTDLLLLAPLLAALRLSPARTGAVGLLATTLALLLAFTNEMSFREESPAVLIVAVASVMAVWVALLRERVERAGRRAAYLAEAERASRHELQEILDGVADGVTAMGPNGKLVYANHAAVRAMGLGSIQEALDAEPGAIAAAFDLLTEDGEPFPPDELPGRRALRGERPDPAVVRFRPRTGGEERWAIVKSSAVLRPDGEGLVISVMEDVTESKRAERRQRFLARAGELLAASLNAGEVLQAVARHAVPDVADWCAIDLVEPDGRLRSAALVHARPEKVALAREQLGEYRSAPQGTGGAAKVLLSGRLLVVPMIARGRALGTISLAISESSRRFEPDDVRLAEQLAGRTALAVDNARLYAERTRVAHRLQESLLPPSLPRIPGIEPAARFRAAGEGNEVGGDFYDLFAVGDDAWAVVIGDVCGKGADAAAVTAQARYTLRAAALQEPRPSRMLAVLNEAMFREHANTFCTVACALLELGGERARLTASSAGHPLPLLLRAGGRAQAVGEPGTLLGVVADPELPEHVVTLQPGDALVLYTDGVTEARAPERFFGQEELVALLEELGPLGAAELALRVEEAALGREEGSPRDDIAILVLRMASDLEEPVEPAADRRTAAG